MVGTKTTLERIIDVKWLKNISLHNPSRQDHSYGMRNKKRSRVMHTEKRTGVSQVTNVLMRDVTFRPSRLYTYLSK